MAKKCALSTGNLLQGGLPRNSVDRITDRPDMTSAVYCGLKASTKKKKKKKNCEANIMILAQMVLKIFCSTSVFEECEKTLKKG